MPAGRPTDYGPEILAKADEYLTIYKDLGHVIPSIAGLADHLGVTRKTCHVWAGDDDKHEFCYIIEKLAGKQELRLTSGGLAGELHAGIVKMILTKHGYSDAVRTDNVSTDGSMSPKPVQIVINPVGSGVFFAPDGAED